MNNYQNSKRFDLEERTYEFAKNCRDYVKNLPKTISNFEYGKQLIRSSGSQAANYIEANEALSKKDFVHRIKISKKETKESILWLKLIISYKNNEDDKERLIKEAIELMKIFGSIFH